VLPESLIPILREHLRAQAADRLRLGPAYQDHGLLFANSDGTPMSPDSFTRDFKRLARAHGHPDLHLHGLRHTIISLLLAHGASIPAVAGRAGDKPEAIVRRYAHELPGQDRELADMVESLGLFGDAEDAEGNWRAESVPAKAKGPGI